MTRWKHRIQGPEDDVEHVLETLKVAVGEGNFDFVSQEDVGMDDDEAVEALFAEMLAEAEEKEQRRTSMERCSSSNG